MMGMSEGSFISQYLTPLQLVAFGAEDDAASTAQIMKFSFKDFFSKCYQIRRKLRIWSPLLKKFEMENFIFSAVLYRNQKCSENSCSKKTHRSSSKHVTNSIFSKVANRFWQPPSQLKMHILTRCFFGSFLEWQYLKYWVSFLEI